MAHTEALEILRGLIERIDIVHKSGGIEAIITGDIVQIIAQANPSNVSRMFESSVKMVACLCGHSYRTSVPICRYYITNTASLLKDYSVASNC